MLEWWDLEDEEESTNPKIPFLITLHCEMTQKTFLKTMEKLC